MKLKRGPRGLFSTWRTLDDRYEFVFDDTQKGGSLPPRGQWLVYDRTDPDEEPMYFGASLTRGFATLREAKDALCQHLGMPDEKGREIQDLNGVKVRVHRTKDGTTVQADCSCFGTRRVHSTPDCPNLKSR